MHERIWMRLPKFRSERLKLAGIFTLAFTLAIGGAVAPAQQPMKFEFVINLQTAKQIGVTINTDVLARATKIIR